MNQFETSTQPKKKKFIPVIIIAVILVTIIGGSVYASRSVISNIFQEKFAKPEDYYHRVENNNINNDIDNSIKSYSTAYKLITSKKYSSTASIHLDFSDELKDQLGKINSKLNQINSAELTYKSSFDNSKEAVTLAAKINDANLVSGNGFIDFDNAKIYGQIPEISDSYLDFSSYLNSEEYDINIDSLKSLGSFSDLYPEPEKLESILKKYSNLFVNSVSNVEKTKTTITANSITQDCIGLTIKMSGQELYDSIHTILETAKDDKDIQSVIDDMINYIKSIDSSSDLNDVTSKSYSENIDSLIQELEESKDEFTKYEDLLDMFVYVDNKGNIIGRTITITADKTYTIEYKRAIKATSLGIESTIKEGDKVVFLVKGKGSSTLTEFSGDFVITFPTEEVTINATVSNGDVSKLLDGTFNGDITLTTTYKDLEDYKLNLSVKTSLLSSLVKVEALDKENSCGILTLKQESTNKADIDFPDTNSTFIDVSDSNALDNYISNFNIESFINDFASRANLDISYSDIVSDTLGYYSSLKNDYNASDYNFSDFDASDYNTSDFDISDYDSSDFDSSDSYISDYTSDLDIY